MNLSKKILFTFDYELFLGVNSGTVNNCLIKPTEKIMELFDIYKIEHAIFFVDTTYLLRLKEMKSPICIKDYEAIISQLIQLVDKGHYIFPHIHPHWLDAIYDPTTNQWSLNNYTKYRFHAISPEQRESLFEDSIALLRKIVCKSKKKYSINAYRAGGWSIQPFADFLPCFRKYGIRHEFSVLKGFKNLSEAQYFNFTTCPSASVYRFSKDPCILDEQGEYIEYTISTLPVSYRLYWLSKLWAKYLWKIGQRSIGDGKGLVIKEASLIAGKKDLIGSENREMISLELLTTIKMPYYKAFLKNNDYMHFISHPKMLSEHNLKCFNDFLKYGCTKFHLQTDFLKINAH